MRLTWILTQCVSVAVECPGNVNETGTTGIKAMSMQGKKEREKKQKI